MSPKLLDVFLPADEIARRASRAPDHEAENRVLRGLIEAFARAPEEAALRLVEAAMTLCDAESALLSLEEQDATGARLFRWRKAAGALTPYVGTFLPHDASPGGVVAATAATQLVHHPERLYGEFGKVDPPIVEGLVAPVFDAGRVVGVLWVAHHHDGPKFDAEDRRRLEGLASLAAGVWRADEARRVQWEAKGRTDAILASADVGTWLLDPKTGEIGGDANLGAMFGFTEAEARSLKASDYLARIHPEDGERVRQALERSLQKGTRYEVEFRILAPNHERWVVSRGNPERDADGRIVRIPGVVVDITEQVHARSEAHRREAKYRSLFDTIDEGFCTIEVLFDAGGRPVDYRFLEVNPAFERQTGLVDAVGKTIRSLAPTHETYWFEVYGRVALTGEPVRFENRAQALDDRWYEVFAFRLGEPERHQVAVLFNDVSERRRNERAVRESEERFRTVFDEAPDDAILVMDANRNVVAWNPAAERITGWSAAEAIGGRADRLFTAEDRAEGVPQKETSIAHAEGRATDERWHMKKDGSRFWGSGTTNALHDAEGNVNGYLKVFRDATRLYEENRTLAFLRRLTDTVIGLRDADEIVRVTERMLGEHLGASRVLFAETSEDGGTVTVREDWTDGAMSLVGTHRVADFGPRVLADFAAGRAHVSRDSERDYAPGEGLEAVRAIGAAAGVSVSVLKEGRFAALVVVHQSTPRDWTEDEIGLVRQVADRITAEIERARAENALRELNAALEARVVERTQELADAVEEAKSFNYSIAHDLRSPLRAISSTAHILLDELGENMEEEHRELLARQAESATRLGRLIDELLRLSRLSRVEVRCQPLDMTQKAHAIAEEIQADDTLAGCAIDIQPGMTGEGDPDLVRTVLQNLIGNACKFSPQGGTVRVRQDGGVFSVSDAGIGFDMKYADKLFLPFHRLVHESDFPGTGIGLANVERIVRRHGGRVWAESTPGHGATFYFTLGEGLD